RWHWEHLGTCWCWLLRMGGFNAWICGWKLTDEQRLTKSTSYRYFVPSSTRRSSITISELDLYGVGSILGLAVGLQELIGLLSFRLGFTAKEFGDSALRIGEPHAHETSKHFGGRF